MKKQKRARVVVMLTYHEETKALDVFMGDENPEFGIAKRVVEKDGITVGVREGGEPVFIRIAGAQNLSKTFKTIAKYAGGEKPINAMQQRYVFTYCLNKTDKLLELAEHQRPKLAKFVFSSVAEIA